MNEADAIEKLLKSGSHLFNGVVLGLCGTLGAGKTQFVKNLLKTIEPSFENQVQSPTFNICNIYSAHTSEVHHYDLYRLDSVEELFDIEIWESIDNSNIFTCIEWVDRFPELSEKCDFILSIQIEEDDRRKYEINKN